jgi:hypothetical protein
MLKLIKKTMLKILLIFLVKEKKDPPPYIKKEKSPSNSNIITIIKDNL